MIVCKRRDNRKGVLIKTSARNSSVKTFSSSLPDDSILERAVS